MTEANKANAQAATHDLFDFKNMPLTNEQKILATLERIETVLTTRIETLLEKIAEPKFIAPPERTPVVTKGRK